MSLDRAWNSHYLIKRKGDVDRVLFQNMQGKIGIVIDAALGSSIN